jgi:threonine synthase
MQLVSTFDHASPRTLYNLRQALFSGLAPDGGLYMPLALPRLSQAELDSLKGLAFPELALRVLRPLLAEELGAAALEQICHNAFSFPVELRRLKDGVYCLELFHGPTWAFKDFGARFMAALCAHYLQQSAQTCTIFVATSGDTGGAVARAFEACPGVSVCVLYPAGRVSELQERQLCTLGTNIHALRVEGSFDDCQALVKRALVEPTFAALRPSSANSINIARLLPQMLYYFYAASLFSTASPLYMAVPSGNFGNLTAGLMAKRMGAPISRFIAATNQNCVVPDYLERGLYQPRASLATISNAMDVGAPNNFPRMQALVAGSRALLRSELQGYWCDDAATRAAIARCYRENLYILDPHAAVAYSACHWFAERHAINPVHDAQLCVLATAHPAKFSEIVDATLGQVPPTPEGYQQLFDKEKRFTTLENSFEKLREWALDTLAT